MVQKLQPIRGGGGSIKVGATGTISSLMMRELETMRSGPLRSGPQKSVTSKNKSSSATSTVSSAASVPKKIQQSKSFEEVNNGRRYNSANSRSFGNSHNSTKAGSRDVHRMPMLDSNDICTDGNSYRKPERKGLRAVAIVDVKCNNPDRAWASRPLSSRLRKLGFAKLSETFA